MKGFKLLFIFFVLSFYSFGAGIMDSFVVYHDWQFVGETEFARMHQASSDRIVPLYVWPLLIGTICNILLLWYRPAKLPKSLLWMSLGCQVVIWLSSVFIQIPMQFQLHDGKDPALLNRLIATDWIRVIAAIANITVVGSMAVQVWKAYANPVKYV